MLHLGVLIDGTLGDVGESPTSRPEQTLVDGHHNFAKRVVQAVDGSLLIANGLAHRGDDGGAWNVHMISCMLYPYSERDTRRTDGSHVRRLRRPVRMQRVAVGNSHRFIA